MHGRQEEDAMVSSVIMQNNVRNVLNLLALPILIVIVAQVSGAAAVVIQLFAATFMRYLS